MSKEKEIYSTVRVPDELITSLIVNSQFVKTLAKTFKCNNWDVNWDLGNDGFGEYTISFIKE